MVSLLTAVGWWQAGFWLLVLEREDDDKHRYCSAKSITILVHSGILMKVGIHFEHTIWALIIVPIALIHSEHVFAYITEVLRAAIGQSWQQTRRAWSHGNQMSLSINQSKWPTYNSSHYCINAMKQYNCIAKIQISLYCNMANQNLFARYCCIIRSITFIMDVV